MAVDPFSAPLLVGGLGFTGAPLDRADHLRTDGAALDALRKCPTARFLAFADLQAIVDHGELLWFKAADIPADVPWVFLGLENSEPRFVVDVVMPGEKFDVRAAAAQMPFSDAAILGQARSLLSWHSRHQHCAVCGAHTNPTKGGYQRTCDVCKAEHFPRTDPVVIMLVIDGERCVLGRQSRFPAGFYSSLAGFIEPGESVEEAVAREVYEEASLRVGRVRYVASQPWPFPSSLMIGCFAEATSFEITVDTNELEDAKWFTKAEVCAALAGNGPFKASPPFAIAHNLLQAWANLK